MRRSTAYFFDVAKTVNEGGYIADANVSVACAKAPLAIATHSIHIASISLHKHSVVLSAAHISHHDVKAANFWEVVDDFLAADSQLAIVVVWKN